MTAVSDPVPRPGHVHQGGFYSSDEQFRALVMPFLERGLIRGEPVVIAYDPRRAGLLRDWLGEPPGALYVDDLYRCPAAAIATYRKLFARLVGEGAARIRIAGDVPHAHDRARYPGWDRYESAVNVVWDEFPVLGRCLYDATATAPEVADVVERTHPYLVTGGDDLTANPRYEEPGTFEGLAPVPDPLEAREPLVELADPSAASARAAVREIAAAHVAERIVNDLVLAVSEATSNALLHGEPPLLVRIWARPDRVVVHVRDRGPGPENRLAGLVPAIGTITGSGLGLWLAHQLDLDVALLRGTDGFTVRVCGGSR
ncbi:sensor histidine kinase [Prauserella cavernicola]|uniref:Sensor histidine kinase n=1 Tax=Prauserella cavernicola TaxID=2800127 RepID=A0A934V549_9PSEU|nr:sensor histidine kinase [Prauserella cavernicola]MBK1789071.1 sensor histidine kinase [Prauserella cavernicola]